MISYSQPNTISQTFLNDYNELNIMFIIRHGCIDNNGYLDYSDYHDNQGYQLVSAVVHGAIGIERDSLGRRNN
jgi:hypothetical protein